MFNDLFGPSIHLLILDMFLDNPEQFLNLRSIARKVNKNPGSISRVMPMLVMNSFLEQIKVGKTMYVYRLNKGNEIIQLIMEFYEKLKKTEFIKKIKKNSESNKLK